LTKPTKWKEYTAICLLGGAGYSLLELLWRGFTHWTMTVTGSVCFALIYRTNEKMRGERWWKKCAAGSFIVTSVELMVGCVINIILRWNVWDYSGRRFHVMGQICPLYSALWFLLCIPLCPLTAFLRHKLQKTTERGGNA